MEEESWLQKCEVGSRIPSTVGKHGELETGAFQISNSCFFLFTQVLNVARGMVLVFYFSVVFPLEF